MREAPAKYSFGKLTLLGLGIAGLAVNIFFYFAIADHNNWNVDFNQYYSAGKLVGTGRLYDWNSIRSLELEHTARTVTFTRIPAFALAFKPLSAVPWPVARALWLAIGIAALAGYVWLWPGPGRAWASIAVLWSSPAAICLITGQDSVVFLFCWALGLRLLVDERDFLAGVAFSACIIKPHLAVLLPVLLLARGKWKTILGGAIGAIAALALSFVSGEGSDWPHRLIALTTQIDGHPLAGVINPTNAPPTEAPVRMPNLRGFLSFAGGGIPVELIVGLLVVVALWLISRKCPLPVSGAIALAGGLLLGHHAYMYDATLLLPVLLLPFLLPAPDWIRRWALFLVTPLAYVVLVIATSRPVLLVSHVLITGYVLALIGVFFAKSLSRNTPEHSPEAI